jgi:hypothetical protein
MNPLTKVKHLLLSLTLEPGILVSQIGIALVYGNGMNTDLLMTKLCRDELNFEDAICRDEIHQIRA